MAVPQSSDNVVILANAAGPPGPIGPEGWSPILTYQDGDSGTGLYITDWTGGIGTKPPVNIFVGAISIVAQYYAPIVEPTTPSTGAVQYFDVADNIMKIKYSDGSILELVP